MKHEIETKYNINDEVFCIDWGTYIPSAYRILGMQIGLSGKSKKSHIEYRLFKEKEFNTKEYMWQHEEYVFASFAEAELAAQKHRQQITVIINNNNNIEPYSSLGERYRKRWVGGKYVDELIK